MTENNSNDKSEQLTSKEAITYAFNYFQLHANQRMSLVNFYIIFASLLTTGIVTASQDKFKIEILPLLLSVMLIVISFIFWKLDCRVKFILKHVEDVLKAIEASTKGTSVEKMFEIVCGEEIKTQTTKNQSVWLNPHLSYSKCLGSNYLFFGTLGFICLCYTIWKMIGPLFYSTIYDNLCRFLCICRCPK